jgi:hypothetical protein
MSLDLNGTNQWLSHAAGIITATPLTIACWFKSDNDTTDQCLFSLGNTGTTGDLFALKASMDAAGNPVRMSTAAAGAFSTAASSTGATVNVWHHACGVSASATSRAAYIDGGSKGTNTTSRTPSGINASIIGRSERSTPIEYFNGEIAEVALWNVALGDDEVASLGKGCHPFLVRPESLVAYWPVWGNESPELDYFKNQYSMTLNGAPSKGAGGPPVCYPYSPPAWWKRRRWTNMRKAINL